MLISTIKSWF